MCPLLPHRTHVRAHAYHPKRVSAAPQNLTAMGSVDGVTLDWDPVDGATGTRAEETPNAFYDRASSYVVY